MSEKSEAERQAMEGDRPNSKSLYDQATGHPHGGQHAGRQKAEGQHDQRPKPGPQRRKK